MSEEDNDNKKIIENILKDLNQLRKRCNEFNDIKQNVKQMNNILKDDLFINIGSLAILLREKVDEFSNQIKDKLKTSYKLINETQSNFVLKLNEIESEIQQKQIEFKLTNLKQQTNDEFNEQLYKRAKTKLNEIEEELSKCDINALYPEINYKISSQQLIDAINSLKIDIIDNDNVKSSLDKFIEKLSIFGKDQTNTFDCEIKSGINENGVFWLSLLDRQVGLVIDEINKFIRYKRVTDSKCLTYFELNKEVMIGEKCFCLDLKTHKWMRGIIEDFNKKTKKCQIRYLDNGVLDSNIDLDCLLEWDNELGSDKINYQAFKCCLFFDHENAVKSYNFNLKCLFKDLTFNKQFKCVIKDFSVDENLWFVELFNLDDYKKLADENNNSDVLSLNKKFIDFNNDNIKKAFTCEDIRLTEQDNDLIKIKTFQTSVTYSDFTTVNELDDEFVISSVLDSIISEIEANELSESKLEDVEEEEEDGEAVVNESANLDETEDLEESVNEAKEENLTNTIYDLDIYDQSDERRLYKKRAGGAYLASKLNRNYVFWLQPLIDPSLHRELENISSIIDDFIKKTKHQSYVELKTKPQIGTKCFFRLHPSKYGKNIPDYRRGCVEEYDKHFDVWLVRFLDRGCRVPIPLKYIYPYKQLDEIKHNFRAIRCTLTTDTKLKLETSAVRKYAKFIEKDDIVKFNLVEQIVCGNVKCWYTELFAPDGSFLNKEIMDDEKKPFKHERYKKIINYKSGHGEHKAFESYEKKRADKKEKTNEYHGHLSRIHAKMDNHKAQWQEKEKEQHYNRQEKEQHYNRQEKEQHYNRQEKEQHYNRRYDSKFGSEGPVPQHNEHNHHKPICQCHEKQSQMENRFYDDYNQRKPRDQRKADYQETDYDTHDYHYSDKEHHHHHHQQYHRQQPIASHNQRDSNQDLRYISTNFDSKKYHTSSSRNLNQCDHHQSEHHHHHQQQQRHKDMNRHEHSKPFNQQRKSNNYPSKSYNQSFEDDKDWE